eukprot:328108-Rhodomonas_salina.1
MSCFVPLLWLSHPPPLQHHQKRDKEGRGRSSSTWIFHFSRAIRESPNQRRLCFARGWKEKIQTRAAGQTGVEKGRQLAPAGQT